MTFGDIFENYVMDTGPSSKLCRHQFLGHLQKLVGSAEDRLRRSFEVRHMLVNSCTYDKTEVSNIIRCHCIYKTGFSIRGVGQN